VLLKENETVLSKLHELANQGDNSQVTQGKIAEKAVYRIVF